MRRVVARIIKNGSPRDSNKLEKKENEQDLFRLDFGSISEFFIKLDDPHKSFYPGEEISGQIILFSKKKLANIVITLSLVGFIKIKPNSHSKMRPSKYILFNHSINIFGDEQPTSDPNELSNGLYKGEHRFPFIVKLPKKKIFTSIDFGRGFIRYSLKATIAYKNAQLVKPEDESKSGTQGGKTSLFSKGKNFGIKDHSYTSEKIINLVNPLDVSKLPPAKAKKIIIRDPRISKKLAKTQSTNSEVTCNTAATFSSSDTQPCEQNGAITGSQGVVTTASSANNSPTNTMEENKVHDIKVFLDIPEPGYLRGELIPIRLSMRHLRNIKDMNGIIITLVRVCRLDNGPGNEFESFRKDLEQVILPLYVDPHSYYADVSTTLRVPADAFPTISGCPFVSFQYFVEVLVNISGRPVQLSKSEVQNSSIDENERSFVDNTNEDSKFNFYANSSMNNIKRSEFVNTDKYKRMKKFAQLTAEVIIGTSRSKLPTERLSRASPNDSSSFNLGSRRSSISTNTQSPHDSSSPTNGINTLSINHHLTIDSNLSSATYVTPPYIEDLDGYPVCPVPDYNEVSNLSSENAITMPDLSHLSEKEQLRHREVGLFPSEPNFSEGEEDSPIPKSSTDGGSILEPQADTSWASSEQDTETSEAHLEKDSDFRSANNE